ncbi:hypothetical protein vBSenM1_44 [Salmonella phage vB_SenM-1]|uniref:Uncharacterized protein n=1 Tax=Salmonella phage vB_SenM-1 TaxID=2732255 RepID=A0A6M4BCL5_9CAUD|nr:hypothetical protein vBSenM1_44 [Salmonella phage vB_SenM-1]
MIITPADHFEVSNYMRNYINRIREPLSIASDYRF